MTEEPAPTPETTTGTVVVVGSVNADDTLYVADLPRPGQTVLAHDARQGLGGKGANQAVAAARAGAATYLVGAVGDDADGAACRRTLEEYGVGTAHLARVADARTGRAVVTVSADGENCIVVAPGANLHVPAAALDGLTALLREETVVLSQGELDPSVLVATARAARTAGVPWVLNLAPVVDVPAAVVGSATVLVVNEEELHDVARRHGLGDAPVEELAPRVRSTLGCPAVVVTLGARGSVVADGHTVTVPAAPVDTVVDTTGAGDAYVGTLAAHLAAGSRVQEAVLHATTAGAAAVGRRGAQ